MSKIRTPICISPRTSRPVLTYVRKDALDDQIGLNVEHGWHPSNWPGTFSLQRMCVDQADGAGSSALGSEILSSPASVTRLIAPLFPDILHPPAACSNGILQQAYVVQRRVLCLEDRTPMNAWVSNRQFDGF